MFDPRRGEPAEILEHLGVAKADASGRRHRHDPRRSIRGARHRQRHQDVLACAVPGNQRALVGDRGVGVVGNVGSTAARPRRARDVEQHRACQHNEYHCDPPAHAHDHGDLLPGESYFAIGVEQAPEQRNNTRNSCNGSLADTTCHVYYAMSWGEPMVRMADFEFILLLERSLSPPSRASERLRHARHAVTRQNFLI